MFNYLVPTMKTVHGRIHSICGHLNNKAMLLAELGRLKEAGELLEEALRLGKTVLDGSISIMKGSCATGRSSNNNLGTCPPPSFQGGRNGNGEQRPR